MVSAAEMIASIAQTPAAADSSSCPSDSVQVGRQAVSSQSEQCSRQVMNVTDLLCSSSRRRSRPSSSTGAAVALLTLWTVGDLRPRQAGST